MKFSFRTYNYIFEIWCTCTLKTINRIGYHRNEDFTEEVCICVSDYPLIDTDPSWTKNSPDYCNACTANNPNTNLLDGTGACQSVPCISCSLILIYYAFIAICRTLNVVDFVVDVIHEIKYIFKKSFINLYYIDTRGASFWNKSLLFRMIKLGTNLRVTWRSSSPIHELRKIAIHVRGEGHFTL